MLMAGPSQSPHLVSADALIHPDILIAIPLSGN